MGLARPALARAEGADEAAIDALLALDGFAEIVASWRENLDESSADFVARATGRPRRRPAKGEPTHSG